MTTTQTSAPTDRRAPVRALLALPWIGGPLYAMWRYLELMVHFFGESATAAEEAEAARWLAAGAAVSLVAAVMALLLGGRRRWRVAIALSLGFCALVAPAVADLRPDTPPQPEPRGCVVYSGGDNPCPGG